TATCHPEQLRIPAVRLDQALPVGREKVRNNKKPLFLPHHVGVNHAVNKKLVPGSPCRIIIELFEKRRDEIEYRPCPLDLVHYGSHIEVIFYRMEIRPGEYVLSADRILVQGLMHMPHQNDRKWFFHYGNKILYYCRQIRPGSDNPATACPAALFSTPPP